MQRVPIGQYYFHDFVVGDPENEGANAALTGNLAVVIFPEGSDTPVEASFNAHQRTSYTYRYNVRHQITLALGYAIGTKYCVDATGAINGKTYSASDGFIVDPPMSLGAANVIETHTFTGAGSSTNTGVLDSSANNTDNTYFTNMRVVKWSPSATSPPEVRFVVYNGYVASTRVITVDRDWNHVPISGDVATFFADNASTQSALSDAENANFQAFAQFGITPSGPNLGLAIGVDSAGVATLLTRIPSALSITAGAVTVSDRTGFALTSAYDAAKTAAAAGAAMALTSGERVTVAGVIMALIPMVKNGASNSIGFFMRDSSNVVVGKAGTPTVTVNRYDGNHFVATTGTIVPTTPTGAIEFYPSAADSNASHCTFAAVLAGAVTVFAEAYPHS